MSRIAGASSAIPEGGASGLLARMVPALRTDPAWQVVPASAEGFAGAWVGWRMPRAESRDGVLVLLDGWVYNKADLKDGARGDTAAILALYREHGFAEAVGRINGDFAIALYDASTRTLWLARDRFGVRPLYFASGGGAFAFASRPGALLGLPFVSRELNRQYVGLFAGSHYRAFDNDPVASPFADIAQLPAAHVLEYRQGRLKTSPYWALTPEPDLNVSDADLADRYRELLVDAVSVRLKVADRPAFSLSGGMDSSSVLSCAVHLLGARQHAFSAVYEDRTYDESEDIRSILDATVERWHSVRVGHPDIGDVVARMVRAHDEPVATATWLAHFVVGEVARERGFGSLFGGLGGDELNAGEYEYFFFYFADLRAAGREQDLRREVERWAAYHDHPVFRKDWQVMEDGLTRLVDFSVPGRCLPDRKRLMRYAAVLNRDYFDLAAFDPVMETVFPSYLKNRTHQDLFRETMPCCLRAEDRQATNHGLDHFVPFLDHRLVEHMFRVRGDLKIREGVTKHLAREAMRGIVPEETRTRVKKTGWNAPAHTWFAGTGRGLLEDLVGSRVFRERGIYHVPEVRRLINEHDQLVMSGAVAENHMMFLWQLVNLELWLQWVDAGRVERVD